ncbi:NrsF family protein [uncultured Methylobacterium sp.]|uniref:NrsF family protein n=1 Tax=uncultured Methylobacterium sp. TaxID=157278 RepID=UPI0035C9D0DD
MSEPRIDGGARASDDDALIDALSRRLAPVRRLPAPWLRGLGWFAAAIALGLAMIPFADMEGLATRMATLDMRLAALGAVLTALTAAVAAFQSSVPGRSRFWALLPLAPAALWIGSSGLGCLRQWSVPGTDLADAGEMGGCLIFLLGVSAPLSAGLVLMLRRACPLRPNLTAALGGLAAAAAAAALLVPFHPHNATASDLLAHLVVVGAIISANTLAGGRLLAGK